MATPEKHNGQDPTNPPSYVEWLNSVIDPAKRRFNLDEAFARKKKLLEEIEDPEDLACLKAIGETRLACKEGDVTLSKIFPRDYSRVKRLEKQVKVVQKATEVPEWRNFIVKEEAFVVHGEVKIGEMLQF